MDWPRVDIVIITYDRVDELTRTMEALHKRLDYPKNKLRYLLADDATPGDYHSKLAKSYIFNFINFEFVPDKGINGGWGMNANRALRYSDAPYVLQIEDDQVLTKNLDLCAAIACMEVKPEIVMMRFGGTAGTHCVLHQMEADISGRIPEYREGMGLFGKMTYFLLDSGSPTLWIYSNRPHLKRATFHPFYGYYPEGLKLGATEESFCHTVLDKMRGDPYAPVITTLPEWVAQHFDHIGKSYQLGPLDTEKGIIKAI